MDTPVVSKLEVKSHESPDEVRTPSKTRVEVVRLEGFTIGRLNFEPGWRWSECIKPVVGTESCQVSHVGYMVSGQIGVRLDDGTEQTHQRRCSRTRSRLAMTPGSWGTSRPSGSR